MKGTVAVGADVKIWGAVWSALTKLFGCSWVDKYSLGLNLDLRPSTL